MARESYTILILPHAKARFRKLHVSRGFVRAAIGGSVLLLAVALVIPHLVFKLRAQSAVVAELEARNVELRQAKLRFEQSLGELHERLTAYESHASVLAEELGVDGLPSARPAAGGSVGGAADSGGAFEEELSALRSRAVTLDRSWEELDGAWRERERRLGSTPDTMPVRGWFSHGYGWRKDPFNGNRAFHRGIDIVAPAGTPVRAPAHGIVTQAGRYGSYGKRIDVSHGYGYVTRYGHLSEVLVRPGQRVRRGDLIGRVGSTGRSTSPHLHYEIFRDGRRVNPWRYLGDKGF